MMMHGCKGNVTMSVMTRVNKCDRIFFYLFIANIAHEDFFFQRATNGGKCKKLCNKEGRCRHPGSD